MVAWDWVHEINTVRFIFLGEERHRDWAYLILHCTQNSRPYVKHFHIAWLTLRPSMPLNHKRQGLSLYLLTADA